MRNLIFILIFCLCTNNLLADNDISADWFHYPPKPTNKYYYTIGISDPNMGNSQEALKQAKVRASIIYCLLNNSVINVHADSFFNHQQTKDILNESTKMEFFNSVKNHTVKIPRGEIIQKMLSSQGEMIILSRFDISDTNNEVDLAFNETDYLESESKNIVLSEQIKRNSLCSFPEENLKLGYEYIITPQNNKEIQIKTTINDQSRIQLPLNSNKYSLSKFNEGNQINIDHQFVTLNYGLWHAMYTGIKQYLWVQTRSLKIKNVTNLYFKKNSFSEAEKDSRFESISKATDSLITRNYYIKEIGQQSLDLGISVLNTDTLLNSTCHSLALENSDESVNNKQKSFTENNIPFSGKEYESDMGFIRERGTGKSHDLFLSQLKAFYNTYEFMCSILCTSVTHATDSYDSNSKIENSSQEYEYSLPKEFNKKESLILKSKDVFESWIVLELPRIRK